MAKVYVTRCIVKKDGKSYQKGSVIKDLTVQEIKQGMAEHWLEAVGNDDDEKPKETGTPGQDDSLQKMTAGELMDLAVSLGLQADNSMPAKVLRKMIREARR